MRIKYAAKAIALGVVLGTALSGSAAYKYERVKDTSMLTDGCQVIITNTGATMAAGPLENGVLVGVPILGFNDDHGMVEEIGEATLFTIAKPNSSAYYFVSLYGNLGGTTSNALTYSPAQYLDWWALSPNAGDMNIQCIYVNSRLIKFRNDTFAITSETGASQTQLYIITEDHNPWADVYFVTSTNDFQLTDKNKLTQDKTNPDVYTGTWYAEPAEQEITTLIGFVAYDPTRDKEYAIGPAGDSDVDLEKPVAGKYVQVKCVSDSKCHWIVTPNFWDLENQSMEVAVNIHTGDAAFGKDIQTLVESVATVTDGIPVYYTLQGVRVANPTHGLYIRVSEGRATKVMLP